MKRVDQVAAFVDANDLERKTIAEIEQLVRHGYKFIDITVRRDGKEYRFQGDWIARLLREWSPAVVSMNPDLARQKLGRAALATDKEESR